MTIRPAVQAWPLGGRRATLVLLAMAAGQAGAAGSGVNAAEAAAASARTALRGALQLRDVPLHVHATCKDAAPHADDKTIGDYLAGFLAAQSDGANTVQSGCKPLPGAAGVQRCEVWLKHRDKDDEWAWGLRFDMDAAGRRARPGSVRCLGSG